MLAWLSILAFKASGSKKENLGDKLAKFAPGCLLNFPWHHAILPPISWSLRSLEDLVEISGLLR